MATDPLRAQLHALLDFKEAHVTFDAAVDGVPRSARGRVPQSGQHSLWQLVEHLRIAQEDILDFSVNPNYRHKKWPDDYWPASPEPPSEQAWDDSLAAYRRDRETMRRLVLERPDLMASIPHGTGQTYLRQALLVAVHASYHIGQIVLTRRLLNVWVP